MICTPCKGAGLANSTGDFAIAIMLHQNCIVGCFCQHKTGSHWLKKTKKKPPTN